MTLEESRRRYFEEGDFKPARLEQLRGMPHVSKELSELISLLRRYRELWEGGYRLPGGVIFSGPPGMGKTLSARILATESGARLVDGTRFPREGDGWTTEDVVSLFSLARDHYEKKGEVVLLHFEELLSLLNREKEEKNVFVASPAYTAFLSELDGIRGRPQGVFVVACTNSLSLLPEALTRAGRLSRIVEFTLDEAGRREIFEYYLSKKPTAGVEVERLAGALPELRPSAIEEMVEEAHLQATLAGSKEVETRHLVSALVRELMGAPEGSWKSEGERWATCVHEAGHAAVARGLGVGLRLVVVPARNYRKGCTLPCWGPGPHSLEVYEKRICTLLAGKAAEEMVLGSPTLDEPKDTAEATEISLEYFMERGACTNYDTPLLEELSGTFGALKPTPEAEREEIYARAKELREACLAKTREILEGLGRGKLEEVAKALWEREYLLGDEVEELLGGRRMWVTPAPGLPALRASQARASPFPGHRQAPST
ncbi:MAG: AAA family ATPase [Candidatus Hadarchaeales archaeon]